MKTYRPTMQCNSKILDDAKFSNCQSLAITHALGLIRLSVNQCAASTYQRLAQNVGRPTPVALPSFCNQQDWSRIC